MITSILKSKFATRNLFVLITVVLILFGCKKENTTSTNEKIARSAPVENNGPGNGKVSAAMVLLWNDVASYVVIKTLQSQPTPRIPPSVKAIITQW
jgi:hypothetical protein